MTNNSIEDGSIYMNLNQEAASDVEINWNTFR